MQKLGPTQNRRGTAVTFHVIEGVVTSADLVPGATFETLAGETITLDADGYLVVFASNKNRTDPAGELHTNFRLSAAGGYLALRPSGAAVSRYTSC